MTASTEHLIKPKVIYLPGIDGTGGGLFCQRRLLERADLLAIEYPQDRETTYEELVGSVFSSAATRWGKGFQATLIAESFGGALAIEFAARFPEHARKLVLANTFARFPRRGRLWLGQALGRFLPERPAPVWSRLLRGPLFLSPDLDPEVVAAWWRVTSHVTQRAYWRRLKLVGRCDVRSLARRLRVFAEVLVSVDDLVVPCEAGRELARLIPSSRLTEFRAAHALFTHPAVDLWEFVS